ncbi:hypothetical protein N825_08625 [Skermanella stibiiresistens SB22]|uniref:Uncharacterized protein n=1 Tax=Skermanella stibiiresistens SB22 TaxID=1385369 RepID=W9H2W3_9PROT|nr:DUF6166 domain-containing protein [Skermanella stibiiresistens]EWY39057.1 hypothetical protein N825_08625 [Skermanella stibiiresistens SB22]
MNKTYRGDRTIDGILVTVDGEPLAERTDLKRLSGEGFEWSYEGDAPAQLALAILANHAGDETALARYKSFMTAAVANFANEWEMTSADIDEVLGVASPRSERAS